MANTEKFRVVLDTNQIVAAGSRWVEPFLEIESNPAARRIKTVARNHTGLYSDIILAEYVKKLFDQSHPRERVSKLIALLIGAFEYVKVISTACDPAPIDEDDTMFILCAIDGDADLLVPDDNALLALQSDYTRPEILDQSSACIKLSIVS